MKSFLYTAALVCMALDHVVSSNSDRNKDYEEVQTESGGLYYRMQCLECVAGQNCSKPRYDFCPEDRPRCATLASSPDFESLLTCSRKIPETCILTYKNDRYDMLCSCRESMCNKVYSPQMKKLLTNFALHKVFTKNENLTNKFLSLAFNVNTSSPYVYEIVTGQPIIPPTSKTKPRRLSIHDLIVWRTWTTSSSTEAPSYQTGPTSFPTGGIYYPTEAIFNTAMNENFTDNPTQRTARVFKYWMANILIAVCILLMFAE